MRALRTQEHSPGRTLSRKPPFPNPKYFSQCEIWYPQRGSSRMGSQRHQPMASRRFLPQSSNSNILIYNVTCHTLLATRALSFNTRCSTSNLFQLAVFSSSLPRGPRHLLRELRQQNRVSSQPHVKHFRAVRTATSLFSFPIECITVQFQNVVYRSLRGLRFRHPTHTH